MRTTYMAKASTTERNWVVIDATDVPLGRFQLLQQAFYVEKTNQHLHLTLIQVIS